MPETNPRKLFPTYFINSSFDCREHPMECCNCYGMTGQILHFIGHDHKYTNIDTSIPAFAEMLPTKAKLTFKKKMKAHPESLLRFCSEDCLFKFVDKYGHIFTAIVLTQAGQTNV